MYGRLLGTVAITLLQVFDITFQIAVNDCFLFSSATEMGRARPSASSLALPVELSLPMHCFVNAGRSRKGTTRLGCSVLRTAAMFCNAKECRETRRKVQRNPKER